MIHDLKPYPADRDSGVPWLGEVPEHWSLERAKRLFQRMQRPVGASDQVVTCFRDGLVTLRKNRRVTGFTESLKEIGYQGVHRGDLVIHAMDAFAGAIGVSDADGKCTPVYAVCRALTDVNPHYYAYVVREMARSAWIAALAKGIRERSTDFRFETFANQEVLVPPREEQAAIVRFLDHADRQIRRYIRAKQKLIKLLEEQKQAIIHRAVTRGLNPDVCLKPSGVEWLGEVPEHWEVLPVRRLVSLVTSGSRGWAQYYSDEGAIFIQSGNLGRSLSLKMDNIQYVRLPADAEGVRTQVRRDDLLVCITGALTGNTIIVDVDLPLAYVNQHVALVRSRADRITPRFLAYCLHSRIGQSQFKNTEYGGTKQGLSLDDVKSVVVPLPPEAEQQRITAFLDQQLRDLNAVTASIYRQIDLLREYRTRLIADVVTGKLDVRAAAASLPGEEFTDGEALESHDETVDGEEAVDDELTTELEEVEV